MSDTRTVSAILALRPLAMFPRDFELDAKGAIARWGGDDKPTDAEIAATLAVYDASETTRKTEAANLRQMIVGTAQGAVGKSLTTLTAAEVRSLMAILLHKAGGVKADGTVKPLGEWAT